MQLKKGQVVELDIVTLAFEGAGIGSYHGLKVFVMGTMPGDKVEASFTKIKKSFAEAKLVRIIEPSKNRIKEKCKYASQCGGCQLQFMPYEMQVKMKKQHVIDAFERIGNLKSPPVKDVIACDEDFYYRNKMEFSFGYDENMEEALGFHVPGRRYDIIDIDECYLQSEYTVFILNEVRKFVRAQGWKPRKAAEDEGFLRSLYVREGKETGEVMVNLMTAGNEPENFRAELQKFVEMLVGLKHKDKKIVSIYWSKKIAKRGVPTQIKEYLLYGKKALLEQIEDLKFEIMPQSFFQVNTLQAKVLYDKVKEYALRDRQTTVFDLFCGTGTIGLYLARHVDSVLGIELNSDSCRIARENAQKNGIFNIDFYTGDVGKLLGTMRSRPSLIVVDPPRAGLNKRIISDINRFAPNQLIYVSCNPSTLARDCEWLKEYGYSVKEIQPVDMFPQTFHIENICLLEK
ncbi:23S rRNA (uracil(1939)-C(5))-methyltransferase RlmD [Candidatus Peregrinibacteria bacterium]|nr:23S rRNA (uracil(1939)-C(5))-methyltransferase RlmD [Candidatus Peregrinibacteria bacterium]